MRSPNAEQQWTESNYVPFWPNYTGQHVTDSEHTTTACDMSPINNSFLRGNSDENMITSRLKSVTVQATTHIDRGSTSRRQLERHERPVGKGT